MRTPVVAIIALLTVGIAYASEVREFDLKTIALLGRQLYESRNQHPKSLSAPEMHALGATKAALNDRIDKTYKFIVLHGASVRITPAAFRRSHRLQPENPLVWAGRL
jgi:3'-phosphoadenosine 5'-phosphosulfate sulfotransferase